MNTNTKTIFMMLAIVAAFTVIVATFATPSVYASDAQPTIEGGMPDDNITGNVTGGGNMTAGNMIT